jgi:hypothetical protein
MKPKAKSKSPLKTSIYLDQATKTIIAARQIGLGTRSEVIRSCVERYDEICRRECPALTDVEWRFLFSVLNESWLASRPSPSYVMAAIDDYQEKDDQPYPADLDMHKLLVKVKEMFFTEFVAIVDEAERYWAAINRGEKPKTRPER